MSQRRRKTPKVYAVSLIGDRLVKALEVYDTI